MGTNFYMMTSDKEAAIDGDENLEDKKWTVYMHTNKFNGKKYIGITSRDVKLRWINGLGYKNSPHFYNAIQKYGWDNFEHEILYSDLSSEDAFKKEKELIKQYNTTDRNYGYNSSIGGSASALGMHHSEETKKRISESGKKSSYWKGKKVPREYIEKILQTKQENGTILTRTQNPAHRSIYCIEFGKYLDIASDATAYGTKDLSAVIKCCNGKLNSAYGLHFLYAEDVSYQNIINKMNMNTDQHHKKPVYCFELNKVFDSTTEAAKFLGVNPSTIISACNGRLKSAKGLTWTYVKDKGAHMGTNFYLITQSKRIKDAYFSDSDYHIVDRPMFGYEVHLAKTSYGWVTLWESHKFYHSISELTKFYMDNQEDIFIYDEYFKFYTWDEFKKRVIDWNKDNPNACVHINPDRSMPNFNEIYGRYYDDSRYFISADGYDFCDCEFS